MSARPWSAEDLESIDAADLAAVEIPPGVGDTNPDDDMAIDADGYLIEPPIDLKDGTWSEDLLDGRMRAAYAMLERTVDRLAGKYARSRLTEEEIAALVHEAWLKEQPPEAVMSVADLKPLIHESLRRAGIARLGARLLSDISTAPAEPTLLDRLDPEGPTVLFGEGGVGKGVVAASWIVGLVGLGHRVLLVDYEGHPGEWARRVGTLGGRDVAESVLYVMPAGPAWQGVRGPLWAQADDLRALATEHGATYIVVDSAVPACGATDPLKPEAACQYAMGLERIGRPSLTVAHVTKAGDGKMPFGSAFWHNLTRVTWSLARDGETLVLSNRKANNYPWLGRFAVTFTWHDGVLGEVSERSYALALADMIAEVLANGPLTVAEIVAELDTDEDGTPLKPDSIRAALRRGCPERYRKVGDRWETA